VELNDLHTTKVLKSSNRDPSLSIVVDEESPYVVRNRSLVEGSDVRCLIEVQREQIDLHGLIPRGPVCIPIIS